MRSDRDDPRRLGLFAPDQQLVERMHVGAARRDHCIGVRRLGGNDLARLAHPHADRGLGVGPLGHCVNLIEFQLRFVRNQRLDRVEGGIHRAIASGGVAVLGAARGPNAVELLTTSLAHEHAGVRRETVRSLAKIGTENAGLLVFSMLGDSDPEVRAEAARAVAVLKPERAFKSLIEIVKKGDEDEVIEQVLRALGALGDASAVPEIEKRLKGSMFSKPPDGVRIAGLSALAAIGTPHALSLVEKAKADKNPEISSAAAQLLVGRGL